MQGVNYIIPVICVKKNRTIIYFTPREVYSHGMGKPSFPKTYRVGLWWTVTAGSIIALVSGAGMLARGSIVTLAIAGGLGIWLAAWEHGWLKGLRSAIISVCICIGMTFFAWMAWPPPISMDERANFTLQSISALEFNGPTVSAELNVLSSNLRIEKGAIIHARAYIRPWTNQPDSNAYPLTPDGEDKLFPSHYGEGVPTLGKVTFPNTLITFTIHSNVENDYVYFLKDQSMEKVPRPRIFLDTEL